LAAAAVSVPEVVDSAVGAARLEEGVGALQGIELSLIIPERRRACTAFVGVLGALLPVRLLHLTRQCLYARL